MDDIEKEELQQKKYELMRQRNNLTDRYNSKDYGGQFDPKERKRLVAETIVFLRKQFYLTQREISDIIGISPQTYAGYESGRHEPSIETLVRLSFYYGVSMDYITEKFHGFEDDEYYGNDYDKVEFENTIENQRFEHIGDEITYLKNELEKLKEHKK